MEKKRKSLLPLLACTALFCLLLSACAPVAGQNGAAQTTTPAPVLSTAAAPQTGVLETGQLPVRFQRPVYMLADTSGKGLGLGGEEVTVPVGADISTTTGPVALRDILKRLAVLKKMNISWASDVDQFAMVDVDIRAEDDFFRSIENLLRQMDYFHEVQGNTIVVKYRETRKFHVAMPFVNSTYETGVGGDVLGGGGDNVSTLAGLLKLTSSENKFDVWENISKNLDQILEIYEEIVLDTPAYESESTRESTTGVGAARSSKVQSKETRKPATKRNVQAAKGYYSIDKPIGLITVTAPRPLVEKIAVYIDNLKTELYRQISIEAKIVEVAINDTATRGIDWTQFLTGKGLSMTLFGGTGVIYDPNRDNRNRGVTQLAVTGNPFAIAMDFLDTQGPSTLLANPKLSVMNGQPGLITAGDSITYISEVTKTSSKELNTDTFSPKTSKLMSGIGMSVIATIMEGDEIILTLTPVISKLDGDTVAIESFADGTKIGLPRVKLREMSTTVRVKSGEVLVVGGLIDNAEADNIKKVPFLGNIPGLGSLFSHSTKSTRKSELVIMLQPTIL